MYSVQKEWLQVQTVSGFTFDMVPEEHEVRTGAPEYTGRICVIGAELNEDKLAELFKVK